ncbi:MAG TPA: hypothetical protein VGS58_01785 [Candidatus Sulfopaludibacter sp.]|nr:hypothetical protein [Candidatus Sulfopaludibacter sp.]
MAVVSATGLGLAVALFLLIRKMASRDGTLPVTAEWIDELSIERYRPMMRLLDGSDIAFLRTQPGFTPRMANKLRQQRSQIFQGYLRCLNSDFGRVCSAIKLVMLQSKADRPDLAGILIRHQAMFTLGMTLVQVRLLLYRWGLCGVDVAGLVNIFDLMRIELRTLVPCSAAMNA